MSKYAIISRNTDRHNPRTKITFTTSLAVAKKAQEQNGEFAYGDPDAAHNWHRRVVDVYELPDGFRKPSPKRLQDEACRSRNTMYPVNADDVLASLIHEVAERVD